MRRAELAQFKTFAEIREAQLTKAEVQAERSAAILREREVEFREGQQSRDSLAVQWTESLDRPVLIPEVTRMWSAKLMHQEQLVSEVGRKVALASDDVRRSAGALHAATTRRDLAREQAHKARKDRDRRRDDNADQDALDRHAQLRRLS